MPYDSNILPTENLYDQPDNLDAQPEFPLRTKFAFYKETPGNSGLVFDGESVDGDTGLRPTTGANADDTTFPSATILLLLWIIGLCAWCGTFVGPPSAATQSSSKRRRSRKPPSEGSLSTKDA